MGFLCSICKDELVGQGFKGSEVLIAGDEYLKGILKSTRACWFTCSFLVFVHENWARGTQRMAITSVVSSWCPSLNVFPSKASRG